MSNIARLWRAARCDARLVDQVFEGPISPFSWLRDGGQQAQPHQRRTGAASAGLEHRFHHSIRPKTSRPTMSRQTTLHPKMSALMT
jgi:hypothetical protein